MIGGYTKWRTGSDLWMTARLRLRQTEAVPILERIWVRQVDRLSLKLLPKSRLAH